jgi:hypothetical protein
MPFRHRKASLALLSVLALTLSACQPASTTPGSTLPQITPSASPTNPLPGTSPVPGASVAPVTPTPTPVFSITPGASSNPSGGSTATVNLPNGTRLVIALPNRFLSSKGQSVQLNAQLFDANGQALPLGDIKLLFSSSRPLDFSVSDTGVVVALKDSGYSTLTVRVEGTDLTASQLISVDTFVGGGGGGGGSSSPSASPTPLTQVNANVNFDGLGIGEFKVNTYTTAFQFNPSVAMDADGNFVVTWYNNGQDGGGYGIYAQRYDKDSGAQGSEFRVNTYTTGTQAETSVAMDADGDFVVTWYSDQDGSGFGIYAQRYDKDGGAQGSEFRVNTYTISNQTNPSVAMDADGDFVVTWQSYGQDGSNFGVYAQRYDKDGGAQGSEFKVNTYTVNSQGAPSVAMDADGDFVVTWNSYEQDGSENGIYAQRYSADGSVNHGAQGSEFRVNTYTTAFQFNPSVAMDADGDFVVTWYSGKDVNFYGIDGIYAQRYSADGSVNHGAQGSEFRVNTYTESTQINPSVAMDADGDFVVTWHSIEQDGSSYGIYAQRYSADGSVNNGAQGSEFRVNTYTGNGQANSSVAMDAEGDFVVTWTSEGQDGGYYGIYAKQYTPNGMAK